MQKSYVIPAGYAFTEIEIKKSRFIACTDCVTQREQAINFLHKIRQDFPDARHYCWAYLLGNPYLASSAAMSDDGEPSGTAGKPILNVIQHKKIGNIMLIVVRYFGGIKLGAGGLTRAYSSAAEALLSQLEVIEQIPKRFCAIRLNYAQENRLRYSLAQHQAILNNVIYETTELVAIIELPIENFAKLQAVCLSERWEIVDETAYLTTFS